MLIYYWSDFIRFYVDAIPIRAFRNNEALGVPFPNSEPQAIHASLWDGSTWATQGGKEPIDWKAAPFVAQFQGFGVDACQVLNQAIVPVCKAAGAGAFWWDAADYHSLNENEIGQLRDVRKKHVVYDYCGDRERFANPALECARNWYEE